MFDNLVEYTDPLIYDSEQREFEPDGPFYLQLAKQTGGRVLDIGCGTGRITLPLAQAGVEITGLDPAPAMLKRAREKADALPIRWVEGDARTFQLGATFNLIFAASATFQHLLERSDHEQALARIREHLTPGGIFAFDVFFPHQGSMTNIEEEQPWFSYTDLRGREIRVTGTDHYDHVRQVRVETAFRRWVDADGQEVTACAPLALRLFFPQEIEALLHYNGFRVVERYGDWDKSPLSDNSPLMIHVCRLA
jgi:SAM-dependent methyltransferase